MRAVFSFLFFLVSFSCRNLTVYLLYTPLYFLFFFVRLMIFLTFFECKFTKFCVIPFHHVYRGVETKRFFFRRGHDLKIFLENYN